MEGRLFHAPELFAPTILFQTSKAINFEPTGSTVYQECHTWRNPIVSAFHYIARLQAQAFSTRLQLSLQIVKFWVQILIDRLSFVKNEVRHRKEHKKLSKKNYV